MMPVSNFALDRGAGVPAWGETTVDSALAMLAFSGGWRVGACGAGLPEVINARAPILSILIDYNCAVFLISKELLKRCPTRVATLVGLA